MNVMYNPRRESNDNRNFSFSDHSRIGKWPIVGALIILILLLTVSLSTPLGTNLQQMIARAAVDMDVSGDGKAAASDGKENIATDGDSFCSITDDMAGGKFSSLFEGIVNCDNDSKLPNQFFIEYSYTKNPVKIGEKTYLTMTVKDRNSGNPIPNAFVTLAIGPISSSYVANTDSTALAAASTSAHDIVEDKTIQSMYTDKNGHAAFTVQLGPKSDVGVYDTEIEVKKDSYQSSFELTNLRIV
jgi:hypothetical protein